MSQSLRLVFSFLMIAVGASCGHDSVTPEEPPALAIRTQPSGGAAGGTLATQPVIEIRDAAGNLVTTSTATVTASIATGGGTLTGTTSVAAVNGVATFTSLGVTGDAGSRTLLFSAPDMKSVTSANITIVAATALSVRKFADAGPSPHAVIALDPISKRIFVLRITDGTIERLVPAGNAATVEKVYDAATTGAPTPQGMTFGPDGTLYVVDNANLGDMTRATIRRGVRVSPTSDTRVWSTLARTVPYPTSKVYSHLFNGIAVSPDGLFVYVNSGARTDHGEVEAEGGRWPGVREVPLTAIIFRLPASASDILLENDDASLAASGYVFARGVRNSFDLAFAADGSLFAIDNSDSRDNNEELNWIQSGRHYGFPWRMGTNDNPQQFPGYDPTSDKLLNHSYTDWNTIYHNDPTFPARPGITFTDPIVNVGPDANSVRDPVTGIAQKATALGTFTAHRSPTGLTFDVHNELQDKFRGGTFVLGFTPGYTTSDGGNGPFLDASQDLLYLQLTRSGDSYQTTATKIVCGFEKPVDSVIMDGKLYVLELLGTIWEITLPTGSEAAKSGCLMAR